jgi:hypothetical protein
MSQTGGARTRDNMTLSAVVRADGREGAAALDETFFSLAIQDWRDLEIVVTLAAGGDAAARRVAEAIEAQPWPAAPHYRILSAGGAGADGADGARVRGALLGRAVGEAAGRFLTFLDTGLDAGLDAGEVVVYQHGYAALVGRLVESGRGVAAGGCRVALMRGEAGRQFVVTKYDFTLGRSPLDPLGQKSVPLCAHVIDRTRVADSALGFGADTRVSGESELLARLYAAGAPDFSARHVFVCERRLRAGSPGAMLYAAARGGYRLRARLLRLQARLRGRRLDGGEVE